MKSQGFQKEAEEMVQHEKAARAKMPSYKGLERFQLLDKMGEYVVYLTLMDFY